MKDHVSRQTLKRLTGVLLLELDIMIIIAHASRPMQYLYLCLTEKTISRLIRKPNWRVGYRNI